jgi:2-dehydropantoate 2-reductase
MKVTVYGAGAIGGHVAVRLAQGGADVSIVGRGAHLEAIRAKGLSLRAPDGAYTVPVRAESDPALLGKQDAVFVTLKGPSLSDLPARIAPLLGPDTPVAFVMNGMPWWYFHKEGGSLDGTRLSRLDPGDALRQAIGPERTLGGVVYSACTVVEPGVVFTEHADFRLILGEPDNSVSARATAMSEALKAGGFPSWVSQNIRNDIWSKLMGNIVTGPMAVATGLPMRDMLGLPALQDAAVRGMTEAAAIATALGCSVAGDPVKRAEGAGRLAHKPSILQDYELGRPMEIDAQNAVPLEVAKRLGVATPTLDLLCALMVAKAKAKGLYAG